MKDRRRSPAIAVRILLCTALLAPVLYGLQLNVRWLLAQTYGAYAAEIYHADPASPVGLKASEIAASLLPHSDSKKVLHAWYLAGQQRGDEGIGEFRSALQASPADPFLWQAYIRYKISLGQFDKELERSVRRLQVLAPHSYPLNLQEAQLAMQYWYWASPEIRDQWRYSLRFVIENGSKYFLQWVLLSRHEGTLCRESGLNYPAFVGWCSAAMQARAICYSRPIKPASEQWCRSVGLLGLQE